ncbi:LysR family transcriptional regulator [Limnochorda pilosa]|uniref:Transcriptional regulator n=1 Tax=Limnochorda pilosa TaxID=1555112 RepID=A0A0K2SLQ5_LIMPI|nr:LysR family transcriptional regulator [Limnochorda pilosa]BAS28035.1 transcriptional regulator [Limnochorda pilosa]
MDLAQLETFQALVETGSFTAAARRLFVSQPTVSRQIHRLEKECGTALLERGKRGVHLTPAGERFALYGQRLLSLSREALLEVNEAAQASQRVVRIGSGVTTALVTLPRALGEFRRRHRSVRLLVKTGRRAALLDQVVSGDLDLAITTCDSVPPAVRGVHLFDETLVLAAHPDHWLSHRPQPLDAAWLDRAPLIAFSSDVGHRQYLDQVLADAGLQPEITMELDNVALILQYVRMKMGVAFIPWPAALNAMKEGNLRIFEVEGLPEMIRHKYVLLPDRDPLPPQVAALLDHLCSFPWEGTTPPPR